MAANDELESNSRYGIDRVLAISDGVFAFTITLLVIDLVVPDILTIATSTDLWVALSDEKISFINYLLSFLIAGIWWNAHHHNFEQIRDSDSTLRWLNLLFLLWIALLPFFTKILDQYTNLRIAVALYSADQAAAGLFLALSWWYASRNNQLIDRNLTFQMARYRLLVILVAPSYFIISIFVSYFNTVLATYMLFGMIPIIIITHRAERKKK